MNRTNTTTLPIHITPHHLRLSPALREFVRKKLAKVPRFARDVLASDVVLRQHNTADGTRFSASARLALAGRDIHATAAHGDLYTAIVRLVARLTRRLRKRKTRLAETYAIRGPRFSPERHRSPDQPVTPDGAATAITHGEARYPRRRSGGQEQRVFGFRRSAPFALRQM